MSNIPTRNFLDENGLRTFWRFNKQYIDDYLSSMLFIGTYEQYLLKRAEDKIRDGALVIITDKFGGNID